jgi:uncharacterized protein YndB with AHSA1/START domain
MKFKYTMDLDCTPERVWYWLGEPERAKAWQTNVSKTEILEKTPDWVGTTFRETVEENGGSTEMRGVVTKYRENQALAMSMSGKYNAVDVEWRISPMGSITRLTLDSNIRFKSFLRILSIVFRPAFKRDIQRQMDSEYAKLKELCKQNGDA